MAEVRNRASWYNALQRLSDTVDAIDRDTVTAAAVKAHLENVARIWGKIDAAHTIILNNTTTDDAHQLQMQTLEPMEDLYTEIRMKLFSMTPSNPVRKNLNVKLPDMALPTFEGNYAEWPTFSDLFMACIDTNASLNGSQKLQYLKSCTRGEAASLIKTFTITDANYIQAWQLLEEHYQNNREIVSTHLRNVLFQPSIKSQSAAALQQLLTTTLESLRSLKVLGRPTDEWDDIIVVVLVEKFDPDSKAEWAKQLRGTEPPTFKELQEFIQQQVRTLHAKGPVKQTTTSQSSSQSSRQHGRQQQSRFSTHHTTISACQHCKGQHQLYQCAVLKAMDSSQRMAAVKATGVCLNCLKEGHISKDCTTAATCRKCGKRHNTFLHFESRGSSNSNTASSSSSSSQVPVAEASSSSKVGIRQTTVAAKSSVLMKTAVVDIIDSGGVKTSVRLFLDEGGEGCLIRESLMLQLGLKRKKNKATICGVGDMEAMESNWLASATLHSQVNSSSIDVQLYAVRRISTSINKLQPGDARSWSHIEGLQLADPHFYEGGEVDILLGSDVVPYLLKSGLKKLNRSSPVAQETIFGWVLSGNIGEPHLKTFTIRMTCHISDALRRFWELEEVPSVASLTIEEEKCERHFLSTHSRTPEGRYQVRLPFNEKKHLLGGSRDQAFRRLRSLERRLERQPEYKQAYINFMREYESLGHMEKAAASLNKVKFSYYLPHHFVLKEDSSTTKQRTVFDGSAKTTSGVSLNDTLMVGATVQPDLYTLIICFRYDEVALKADVVKMYRNFDVHPDDRDYQRILWREEPHLPVIEYRLTTVTYGTSCAPFCATRCLNQLAVDEGDNFPEAKKALLTSTYVDDYLGSSSTPSTAINLVKQLIGITSKAGMEIRKWCSNSPEVMATIPKDMQESCAEEELQDSATPSGVKALGIKWKPSTDEFLFSVNVRQGPVTKRDLLSEIAKTFDPIGWLTPVTINAKLIMQGVWLGGNEWDQLVKDDLQQRWDNYVADLVKVTSIRIPRCVIRASPLELEIHGFSDSSEAAFSSAVYVKCVYNDGSVSSHLLTSRSRVAPLKCISLPKLELSGAKLLAETISSVQRSFPHQHKLYCWTDSTITLRWIQSHSRRWKTFVANRVAEIQTLVPPQHWNHVRGEDNPADLPSRGISADELIKSDLWWHGPSWLQQSSSSSYPVSVVECNEEEIKKEERAKQLALFHFAPFSAHTQLFSAFSSLQKLYRCSAYLTRFLQYLKTKDSSIKQPLSTHEINIAKLNLIYWCQHVSFPVEIKSLEKEGKVASSSKLASLYPYLDSYGIIRVGGRLQKSHLSEGHRHPIILPNNHQLTELIISNAHHTHLHSGFTLTQAVIRRDYWILRGRDTIRHFIRKCITCRRAQATTTTQLMGSLPAGRVTANRPFLHCGVDYAGPFQVKLKKGRHFAVEKAYFSIFVCLCTKAVHLEAVTSLSSESFIACFERFVSRRGIPAHMYSDCGTNFVGADRILQEYLAAHQSSFQSQVASRGTSWHFNPPSAPHQGGLWEAGVKSVKHHFKRVVGQHTLLLEEFQTLLCKIEACLNSRPLCALSAEPNDLEALTPGHFLIGEPLTSIPEPDVSMLKENRLKQFEIARQLTQHYWKRWSNEYLSSLQQRFKWTQKRDNLEVGDLVVIADDIHPVAKWKLGRILETFPGADGLVRRAKVKTAAGELERPIHKLSPLITSHN